MKPILPLMLLGLCVLMLAVSVLVPLPTTSQSAQVASIPSVSFSSPTYEGREGTNVRVQVRLNAPAQKTTKVKLKVGAGTATAGTDFRASTPILTFYKNGLTTKTIVVPLLTDTKVEEAETIFVSILTIDNKPIVNGAKATITIAANGSTGESGTGTAGSVVDCTQRPPGVREGLMGITSPRILVSRSFSSLYNAPFPGPSGQRWEGQPSGIFDGTVHAFEFIAPIAPQNGAIELAFSPDRGGFGGYAIAISECPGHVTMYLQGEQSDQKLNPCWGGGTDDVMGVVATYWTLDPTYADRSCLLTPGKKYYFNIAVNSRCLAPGPIDGNGPPAYCGIRMYTR